MNVRWILASLATIALACGSVVAGDKPGTEKPGIGKGTPAKAKRADMGEAAFKRLDANGDGKLTLEEFKKMAELRPQGKLKDNPELINKLFERMNENSDGFVALEEFKKARAKMAERLKDVRPGESKPGGKKPDKN